MEMEEIYLLDVSAWASEILLKIDTKLTVEAQRLGNKIPYIPENGHYTDRGDKDITWWTNGFWAGTMWMMYHATGKKIYETAAQQNEIRLDAALDQYTGLHHDVGFMWTL